MILTFCEVTLIPVNSPETKYLKRMKQLNCKLEYQVKDQALMILPISLTSFIHKLNLLKSSSDFTVSSIIISTLDDVLQTVTAWLRFCCDFGQFFEHFILRIGLTIVAKLPVLQ